MRPEEVSSEPDKFASYPKNLTKSQIEFLQSIPIEFHKDVLFEIINDTSSTSKHIDDSNIPVHPDSDNSTLTSSEMHNRTKTLLSGSNQKAKKNPVARDDSMSKISEFLKKLGI
jgi:hypothetical protein